MSKAEQTVEERAAGILAGDRLAITRGITLVENEREGWKKLLSTIYYRTGRGYRIGLTGPPGAGKSTLTQKLISHYRTLGKSVAVIAIDPTSPFTGGAILGDRVRMQSETLHPNVFIRSMATRGSLGGLNTKAQDVADILDAAGFDIIIYETVGVGQSELDIARAADTTAVVLVPESGDSIQAMKSGLMEIADIFALNKADRDGADQAVAALRTILTFRITHAAGEWIPDVIKTVGTTGDGVAPLAEAIEAHRTHLEKGGLLAMRRGARERLRVTEIVENVIRHSFWTAERRELLERELPALVARRQSPLELAGRLAAL